MTDVFRALADPTRREMLDRLYAENGRTLGDLIDGLPISRQAATKHISILENANLLVTHWKGREKLHYLNPVPLAEIVDRWVGKFEDTRLQMLVDLKNLSEANEEKRRA